MSEYEDRYPDAYGRQEEVDPKPLHRHFSWLGLSRQVRDDEPAIAEARSDGPSIKVVDIADLAPAPRPTGPVPQRPVERPRQPLIERMPREICDDVAAQLGASPFIDASGIAVTVDGSEVTLSGTINSLIAISLAKALVSNVPGVGRVQVQMRVQQTPRRYEMAGSPVYKVEAE